MSVNFFLLLRIRHMLKKIAREEISKEDLIKNLEYAAQVLETVYIDETRSVLCNIYNTQWFFRSEC